MSHEEIIVKTFFSEVTCSICAEYFRDPVVLQCGHNFCHDCIVKYWREFVLQYTCPQCKTATETDGVFPNKTLEKFARFLQQMKLETGGKETCEKHQAPWKYFCKNHRAAFCECCAESEDHEGHVKISLEQAAQEFKDYFREFLVHLDNQRSKILKHKICIEEENREVMKVAESLKKELVDTFEDLRHFLNSEQYTQISRIGKVETTVTQKRGERMDELFQEFSSCDKMIRELQKKCSLETNDLLQDISSTLDRCKKKEILLHHGLLPPNNQWEIWILRDANIFLKSAVKQFQESVKLGFSLLQAVITLDKETAHPMLILSGNCKSVMLGDEVQCLPKTQKRFDTSHSVLGCEEFKEGRNYWDISIGKEGDWTVGVALKSVRRKNALSIEPKSGIWAIGRRANEYFAFDSPNCSRLQLHREPRKIRVFFNCTGKHVYFFDADETYLLHHTYTKAVSKEAFVPFFHLSHKAFLILTP